VLEDRRDVFHCVEDVVVREQRDGLGRWNLDERHGRRRHRRQRPLAPGEQAAEVDHARLAVLATVLRDESVEVVPGDVSFQLGEARVDLVGFLVEDAHHLGMDPGEQRVCVRVCGVPQRLDVDRTEGGDRPVGEHDLELLDVVVRLPVLQRVRARRVVSDGAADRRLVAPRWVGRELQPGGLCGCVEVTDVRSGVDAGRGRLRVDLVDRVHRPRQVEHHRLVDRLPGERGTAAARQYGYSLRETVLVNGRDVGRRLRQHHADRGHLVRRGVGRVQPPRVVVESDVPGHAFAKRGHEIGPFDVSTGVLEVPPVARVDPRPARVSCHDRV
jgi:hypothetical protein